MGIEASVKDELSLTINRVNEIAMASEAAKLPTGAMQSALRLARYAIDINDAYVMRLAFGELKAFMLPVPVADKIKEI